MTLAVGSNLECCQVLDEEVPATLVKASVGRGGGNAKDDVLVVQQALNAVPPSAGGPALFLAEDSLYGPKTQAAIDKFQAKIPIFDGRIDPGNTTAKRLIQFIENTDSVPCGTVGLDSRAAAAAGSPNTPAPANPQGDDIVAVGKSCLKVLEPSLANLRFKLTRVTKPMRNLIDKHFQSSGQSVNDADIQHIKRILARTHQFVARANAFGILPIENIIQFDPKPFDPTVIGWTVRGGDKLTTKQVQIYHDKKTKKIVKGHGQTIFLTPIFETTPSFEKHWCVLHEMAHFVGARDGTGREVNDINKAYAYQTNFLSISKRQKLHNAESLSLFFLECCIGTAAILRLNRLRKYITHFGSLPIVGPNGDFILS